MHALQERLQQEAEAKQRVEKELDAVSRLAFFSAALQFLIVHCLLSFVQPDYRPEIYVLVRERTKCEARVGQLVSKVTISCCFPVLSSIIIFTLVKVNKLGGELEEERQLNKSLRENQEEWQVAQ